MEETQHFDLPLPDPEKPLYFNGIDQDTGEDIYSQEFRHGWSRLGEERVQSNRPGYNLVAESGENQYRLKPTHGRNETGDDVVEVSDDALSWVDWMSGDLIEPWKHPVKLGPRNSAPLERYKPLFKPYDEWNGFSLTDKKRYLPISNELNIGTLPGPSLPLYMSLLVPQPRKIQEHWSDIFNYYPELAPCAMSLMATWNAEQSLSPISPLPSQGYPTPEASMPDTPAAWEAAAPSPGNGSRLRQIKEEELDTPMPNTLRAWEAAAAPSPEAGSMGPPPSQQVGNIPQETLHQIENREIANAFLNGLNSPRTKRNYEAVVERFLRYLKNANDMSLFDPSLVTHNDLSLMYTYYTQTNANAVAKGLMKTRNNWDRERHTLIKSEDRDNQGWRKAISTASHALPWNRPTRVKSSQMGPRSPYDTGSSYPQSLQQMQPGPGQFGTYLPEGQPFPSQMGSSSGTLQLEPGHDPPQDLRRLGKNMRHGSKILTAQEIADRARADVDPRVELFLAESKNTRLYYLVNQLGGIVTNADGQQIAINQETLLNSFQDTHRTSRAAAGSLGAGQSLQATIEVEPARRESSQSLGASGVSRRVSRVRDLFRRGTSEDPRGQRQPGDPYPPGPPDPGRGAGRGD